MILLHVLLWEVLQYRCVSEAQEQPAPGLGSKALVEQVFSWSSGRALTVAAVHVDIRKLFCE